MKKYYLGQAKTWGSLLIRYKNDTANIRQQPNGIVVVIDGLNQTILKHEKVYLFIFCSIDFRTSFLF